MVGHWGSGSIDTLDGAHYRNLLAARGNGRGLPDEVSWKQVAAADMVLVVGAEPQAGHPMLVSLLRQAHLERKLPVAVIGQTRDAHLFGTYVVPSAPKDLPSVLATLRLLLEGDAQNMLRVKKGGKPEHRRLLESIARAYAEAKSPLIIAGERLSATPGSGLSELFAVAGAVSGGAALVLLKPSVNSPAAWRLGIASPHTPGDSSGAGLLLLGQEHGDLLGAWAKGRTAHDFLAVITPYYDPFLASIAHVMLPKPLGLEEDGSYTSMDGAQIHFKPRVLDPPAGVLRTWEILQRLFIHKSGRVQVKNWESIRAEAEKLLETFQG
jgi:NADH dehydrogenase/NADH:ubiquinone oxidoreductase subunit G